MLFGAGATLCIVLFAGLMTALFGGRPATLDGSATAPPPAAMAPRASAALFRAVEIDALPGWSLGAQAQALVAWRRSCWSLLERPLDSQVGPAMPGDVNAAGVGGVAADWAGICQALAGLDEDDDSGVRAFVADTMGAVAVIDPGAETDPDTGLFTGYYEPVFAGSRVREGDFTVPLYGLPDDLVRVDLGRFVPDLRGRTVAGRVEDAAASPNLVPYDTRGDIDDGSLGDRAVPIFWLADPLDAFILHIQGSGRIDLPDGSQTRAGFAAHNGHAYRSIGRWLIEADEIEAHAASFAGIRGWMEAHPERAAALLAVNPRYIFFREAPGEGPIGAAGVPLSARRSLAIDPTVLPLGVPIWLDADPVGTSGGDQGGERIQRLMVAQDTGGAIRGVVRGDFFWGAGDGAGSVAGRMSSRGRYFLLLPKPVAEALVEASARDVAAEAEN